MSEVGKSPHLGGAGEYGATTVELFRDGSTLRIAFGRNDSGGHKVYTGAVLLSKEAVIELKRQLEELGV